MLFRLSAIALAIAAVPAWADDSLHLSGFGTLGWSHQDRDDVDYVRPAQPSRSAFGLDSNLGLQASADFSPRFSGTVQVLARRAYTDDFRAAVEWAFLRAKLNDNVAVRVGRVALPAYLISDSRNLGYANLAIRPPAEVYGQVPLSSLDGLDVTGTYSSGDDTTWTAQASFGNIKDHYASYTIEGKRTMSLAVTMETGPYTFRLGHVRSSLSLTAPGLPELFGGLRMAGFDALARRLEANGKHSSFTGFGFSMDQRNVLIQSELTRRTTDSFVASTTAGYVLLGYRMGNLTPYAGYARQRVDSPQHDATVPPVGPLKPLADGINYLLEGEAQKTATLGLRWNALRSASVKVQADVVRPAASRGYMIVRQPTYVGQTVRVLSAAVDFVF